MCLERHIVVRRAPFQVQRLRRTSPSPAVVVVTVVVSQSAVGRLVGRRRWRWRRRSHAKERQQQQQRSAYGPEAANWSQAGAAPSAAGRRTLGSADSMEETLSRVIEVHSPGRPVGQRIRFVAADVVVVVVIVAVAVAVWSSSYTRGHHSTSRPTRFDHHHADRPLGPVLINDSVISPVAIQLVVTSSKGEQRYARHYYALAEEEGLGGFL